MAIGLNEAFDKFLAEGNVKWAKAQHLKSPGVSTISGELLPEEKVLQVYCCAEYDPWVAMNHRTIVLTDSNLYLFLKKNHYRIPFDRISSFNRYNMRGQLTFKILEYGSLFREEFSVGPYGEKAKFDSLMQQTLTLADSSQKAKTLLVRVDENPIDQLKKLKELVDAGVLTQAEFEEKKQILLGKI